MDITRQQYDQLVLETMREIKNEVQGIRTTVESLNQRLTVVETKALLFGTFGGTIMGAIVSIVVSYFVRK